MPTTVCDPTPASWRCLLVRSVFGCLAWTAAASGTASAGTAPNLQQMLQVVPLSQPASAPASVPTAPVWLTRATEPLSPERLSAASTSAGQVLGSTVEGTLIKAYKVAHIRASDVQAMLADPASPLLPRDSSPVVVDSRSNTLLIKGTPAEHQLIENLIHVVDVPARQVLLEVRIVSADEYFGQSLGARFGLTSSHMLNAAKPRSAGVQVGNTVGELNQIGSSGVSSFPTGVNLPATNTMTSTPVSTFALGLYKLPAGININLEISALEEAGHTKVLSSPKLVLSNQRAGLISSGQRIPYSKPSLVQGVSTTEFVDVKVSVAVTALVAPDGAISMDLTLTDDNVGSTSAVGPTINTNQATSNVTLQSGETLLLGGFQSSSQVEEKNQTPLLGSIPVLGHLFKNRSNSTVKRELLFIITPTIIESEPR